MNRRQATWRTHSCVPRLTLDARRRISPHSVGSQARGHHGARVSLEGEDFLAAVDQESTHDHGRRFLPVLSRERQCEPHRAVALYVKAAVSGYVERARAGNRMRNVAG